MSAQCFEHVLSEFCLLFPWENKKKRPENTIMASLQTAQPSQHPNQEKENPKTNSPVTRSFFKAHIAQSYQSNAVYCYCDYRINRSL